MLKIRPFQLVLEGPRSYKESYKIGDLRSCGPKIGA